MNRLKTILAAVVMIAVMASLTSCSSECEHAYHSDTEWTVTKQATCFEEGEAYNTCFKCNEKVVLPIMKLEHVYDTPVINEPTCTAEGNMTQECNLCGMRIISEKKPALGHEYEDGVCVRCGVSEPAE